MYERCRIHILFWFHTTHSCYVSNENLKSKRVIMAEQNCFRYTSECGVQSHLLDRIHDDSSIDSNGASRIFANTHPTIASAKDTDSSTTSNIFYSWPWDSMTNITDRSSWNSNSKRVTSENVPSLLQSFAYDKSIDMRTMKSDSCLSFNETESNDS